MNKKIKSFLILLVLMTAVLSGIIACDNGEPVESTTSPFEEAWTDADVDGMVEIEEKSLYKPLDIEGLPEECNYIQYYRIGLKDSDGIVANADSILLLQSGVIVGNNAFRYLASQIVYMAKTQRNKRIEVILPDRRQNCFEDTTGTNAAEAKKDVSVAIDYYYNNSEIDGKTFSGWKNNGDLKVLAQFGLGMVMEDVYHVMTTLVPKQTDRKEKLFVGGHSLGGFFAFFLMGWDFDGNPETLDDAGYNNCAGVVALDTLLSNLIDIFEPIIGLLPRGIYDMVPGMVNGTYPTIVSTLELGLFPRIIPFDVVGFSAETFMIIELASMLADWKPDEESTMLEEFDYGILPNIAIRLMHSRNVLQFIDPLQPAYIRDFRYTNEAMFGVLIDDNFMPVQLVQSSMGFLANGNIRKKNFPIGSNWPTDNPITDVLDVFFVGDSLFIPDSSAESKETLLTWKNFDEISEIETNEDGSLQYTTASEEMSRLSDVAKGFYQGGSNMLEWYFPTRLLIDMLEAPYRVKPEYGLNYMHNFDYVNDSPVPVFYRIGGSGPFVEYAKEYGYSADDPEIMEGYDHMDIFTAAANVPERRENEVFLPLVDFMIGVSGN